ncbi:hypothetical protein LCGC14_2531480 [marine sediment metagenome]|uniref:PIN domain-containing protein n=1 Tax=marine sediment metagenome TaxID=412755 RepID=A0A0F9BG98_9ZZZZ
MVLAVIDSDVLIHLAKLNQLDLLKVQFSQIFISEIIYNETVVQGINTKRKDAQILQDFIKTDFIQVEEISRQKTIEIMGKYNIHKGESSIIALAEKNQVDYCITNEIKVRNTIKSEGFKVVGTLGIILKAFNLNKIDKKLCLKLLKHLKSEPKEFRFHPKLISRVKKEVNRKK